MSERQVPSRALEMAGATLVVSTSGGYSVLYRDAYIGYIHASLGNQWNAYVRRVGALDDYVGKFGQHEAVRRIVAAYADNVGASLSQSSSSRRIPVASAMDRSGTGVLLTRGPSRRDLPAETHNGSPVPADPCSPGSRS